MHARWIQNLHYLYSPSPALKVSIVEVRHAGNAVQATLPLGDRRRPSNRAATALQRAQHDRVRSVREAARAAMAVIKDLQVTPATSCVHTLSTALRTGVEVGDCNGTWKLL